MYTKIYLNKIAIELDKTAGRGEMAIKLIGMATRAMKNTPQTIFSKAQGKMIDLRKPIEKITGTAGVLKDMIKNQGIKKDPVFTRSLQSDYTRLLRDRLQELNSLTNPILN
jgi:hypothetical protein